MFLAGRGAGKTRAGAEWVRYKVKAGAGRLALVAPTTASAREVMVDGTSGVLATAWDKDKDYKGNLMGRPIYEPSRRRIVWYNGAQATVYSAEEPDRLRGPQHDALWADELAVWKDVGKELKIDAWDMALFGLRIGSNPQAMISTTPKPIPVLRELVALSKLPNPPCVITTATTYQNRPFLAGTYFSHIIRQYEGTRLGRQELEGVIIGEAEGALWTRDLVERAHDGKHADHRRIVVAIDPAVTANAISSLTGIVAASIGVDGRGYVIADASGRYSPDEWARVAIKLFDQFKADRIVAEGNQGGDLVRHTLDTVRRNLPIRIVHASRSKQARAEPIAALYEQGKVTHCQSFEELEDQLCTWQPLSGDPSPDRLDALVWALTELMLGDTDPPIVVPFIASRPRNFPGSDSTRGW